jgi:hypothetical protein
VQVPRELLEGFSQLVSDFIEASSFHKKTAKNYEKPSALDQPVNCFDSLTLKKYSSRDTIPLRIENSAVERYIS